VGIVAKRVDVDSSFASVGYADILPEVSFWMFYPDLWRPSCYVHFRDAVKADFNALYILT